MEDSRKMKSGQAATNAKNFPRQGNGLVSNPCTQESNGQGRWLTSNNITQEDVDELLFDTSGHGNVVRTRVPGFVAAEIEESHRTPNQVVEGRGGATSSLGHTTEFETMRAREVSPLDIPVATVSMNGYGFRRMDNAGDEEDFSSLSKKPRQSTLSQFFHTATTSPRRVLEPFFQSEGPWHVDNTRTLFKLDELYRTTDRDVNFIFQLTEVGMEDRKKCAICESERVMPLEETFLGTEMAKDVIANTPQTLRNMGLPERKYELNMVRVATNFRFGKKETAIKVPLESLRRVSEIKDIPNTPLVYETGPTIKLGSKDFAFAFLGVDMLDPSKWITKSHLNKKPKVLELFAGCGGMTLGFKAARFDESAWLVEENPTAAATLKLNNSKSEVYCEDVRVFLQHCRDGHAGYPPPDDDVGHIHGSPPFQANPTMNRNCANHGPNEWDTENHELSLTMLDAVDFFRPPTVSFENVRAMLTGDNNGGVDYLQKIIAGLIMLGYQCRLFIASATAFGDPQKRDRLILFGARFDCYLPDAPVGEALTIINPMDALSELVNIEPTIGSGRVATRSGMVVTQHSLEGRLEFSSTECVRLSQCETSPTIARGVNLVHPSWRLSHGVDRPLTTRERAMLFSFPLDYQFCGSMREQQDQIGNAVPVKLATAVAEQIYRSHLISRKCSSVSAPAIYM